MTNREKKEWLSRAYHMDLRLRAKMRRAESLASLATRASSIGDGAPVSGGGYMTSRLESIAVRLADLGTEIEHDTEAMRLAVEEIRSAILTVCDQTLVDILEMRYIDMMKWEEISAMLGLSVDYTYQLHRRALEMVRVE